VDDVRQQLSANPQALVTFVTTEHFNLQTARAVTTSESNGRAGIFLSTVSGTLVALAFIAQLSKGGTAFVAFGLVLFPALLFVGLATYDRVLQSSIEDVALTQRINRIRRFYLEAAPALEDYLAPAVRSDALEEVLRAGAMRPGPWQLFLSMAGMVGVLNSVLVGVLVALLAGVTTGGDHPVPAAVAGVAAFVLAVAGHQWHQSRRRNAQPSPFADRRPPAADQAAEGS
jgi:hypothetical protein